MSEEKPNNWFEKDLSKSTIIVFILMFIIVTVVGGFIENKFNIMDYLTSPNPAKPVLGKTDLSFNQVAEVFGPKSKLTELQKDEEWKKYKGWRVTWTGKVAYVKEGTLGGINVGFKHRSGTLTYDVLVDFDSSARSRLLKVNEGDTVTYSGILSLREGAILPYSLKEGQIVRGQRR